MHRLKTQVTDSNRNRQKSKVKNQTEAIRRGTFREGEHKVEEDKEQALNTQVNKTQVKQIRQS